MTRRRPFLVVALVAVVCGVGLGLVAVALDWGLWAIYGALVLIGLAIAGVATPPIYGPLMRRREPVPGEVKA
jgi:hypothetical protein